MPRSPDSHCRTVRPLSTWTKRAKPSALRPRACSELGLRLDLLSGVYPVPQIADHHPHLSSLGFSLGGVSPRPIGAVALALRPAALAAM
jgi:hypothetical protein